MRLLCGSKAQKETEKKEAESEKAALEARVQELEQTVSAKEQEKAGLYMTTVRQTTALDAQKKTVLELQGSFQGLLRDFEAQSATLELTKAENTKLMILTKKPDTNSVGAQAEDWKIQEEVLNAVSNDRKGEKHNVSYLV